VIAIVGGGITGLAAAYELTVRRVPFQLFEASPRLGGIIRTEHVDGFTIEAGPDSILVQKPAALKLCEALGLGPRLITTNMPRTAFILKDGRLHALPSPSVLGIPTTWSGLARYDVLSPIARVRLALEPFVGPGATRADESVGAFFRRRFGPETVGTVAEPLLGGIHAGDIDSLSIRSLFPRFVEAETEHGSVIRSFRTARNRASRIPDPGSGIPPVAIPQGDGLFRSLAGGMEELVSTLEQQLPSDSLHRGAAVDGIARDANGWRLTVGGERASARAVLLACPAHVAADLLAPIDARSAERCREVPYVSTASIALAWHRGAIAHPLNGSGFVVARRPDGPRITACTWVSSKWSGRAPAGMALLRAFVGGSHDPTVVDLPDDELVELARHDLQPVLGINGAPALSRVYRWRRAGAQHNVGQIARVSEIEQRLSVHRGICIAGSGFRSIGIPDCVADGRAAAVAACSTI
jgi:protoporphyrinogen/coproporphyrinogen III oxidase